MSSESKQHWLDRNRPPRVHITYDVETLGSAKKMELPLVVGILADLLGKTKPSDLLKQRKFVQIDRDTFDDFMAKLAPTHTVSGEAGPATLTFKKMEDFEPLQIVKQVPKLNKLLRERQRLVDVVANVSGNDSLTARFNEVFKEGTEARNTKEKHAKQRREPFEKAAEVARNLNAPAQALMNRLEAAASVIRSAQQAFILDGTCFTLEQLFPGEDFTTLQAATGAARASGYLDKFKAFLKEDAGTTLADQLKALTRAVNDASASADKALTELKSGPAVGLKAVTELETKVKAIIADPAKKGELAAALEPLDKIAGKVPEIRAALQELEKAATVDLTEQPTPQEALDAAKAILKSTPLANADALITQAEAFAKKPTQPAELQKELKTAFPTPLSGDLEKLSQAQVLFKQQQAITDAAEARVIRAQRFMDARSQEKALAAHREAVLVLETAKKIASLVEDINTALAADIEPARLGQLAPLLPLAEALHGATDAAVSETQQQLDAFTSPHP